MKIERGSEREENRVSKNTRYRVTHDGAEDGSVVVFSESDGNLS